MREVEEGGGDKMKGPEGKDEEKGKIGRREEETGKTRMMKRGKNKKECDKKQRKEEMKGGTQGSNSRVSPPDESGEDFQKEVLLPTVEELSV